MFFYIFISTYLFIYYQLHHDLQNSDQKSIFDAKKQKVVLGGLLRVKGSAFPVHTLSLEVYLHSFVVDVTPHSV